MKSRRKKIIVPMIGIGAILLIWYGVCRAELFSAYVLPPPYRVFRSFYKMAVNGELWKDISISFLRVIKGFYIAFALAFGLGMIRFLLPGTAKYYEYMVRFFRNVPPLAMIPLLILWCGEIQYEGSQRTAFVFQEPRLMPWLTVWDNVAFGIRKKEQNSENISGIISTVGLEGFEKAYPFQLSGGMQQRAAIARALAYRPSFIMMDEPFAALDYFTREQMQKELLRVRQKQRCSILFVTHSIDEALLLGHKIVVIENGLVKTQVRVPELEGDRNLLDEMFISLKRHMIESLNTAD